MKKSSQKGQDIGGNHGCHLPDSNPLSKGRKKEHVKLGKVWGTSVKNWGGKSWFWNGLEIEGDFIEE